MPSLVRFLTERSRIIIPLASLLVASPASALQPLSDFVTASHTHGLDNRESLALIEQRDAEADQAWSRLAPVLTGTGQLTRNQYAAEVSMPTGAGQPPRTITVTPQNQWDLIASVSLPLVDVGAWQRISAADKALEASRARRLSGSLEVERQVARAYYQTAAAEAVLASARRALSVSEESLKVITLRKDAGLATDLDAERARAEVERNRGTVADAELLRATSRRSLETLSGLAPTEGAPSFDTEQRPDAPSDEAGDGHPSVRSAELEAEASARSHRASQAALLPTLTLNGNERYTNAVGFGQSPSYSISLALTVRLDLSTVHAARASEASAAAARVREERSRRAARDAVFNAQQQQTAQIAKSRSARAQVEAARKAAEIARSRYQAGTATLLDSLQADRDAFAADVARVQADADLAYARAQLRLAQGRSLEGATP